MGDKILVTARSFRDVEGEHQEILRQAGYELVFSPYDRPLQPGELAELVGDVVAVIAGVDHFSREVFERAPRLRVVSRFGVGVDTVDLSAATEHGVVVTTTPGANAVAVAELTILLMLALSRRLLLHDRWIRSGTWKRETGMELMGATLGIVGLGNVGREVAIRARAFGMRVLAVSLPPQPDDAADEVWPPERLPDLLSVSDVVSLHLPLSPETYHLIGARELALMKPSALLINTARGGLVDEQALYEALKEGRLAGAAFDVFEQEPPGNSPLLQLDNFIATPHMGSTTLQTVYRMGQVAARNALAVLEGRRPEGVINPEVYTVLREKRNESH